MANPEISIIMGSDSDLDTMREASSVLTEFGVAYEMKVMSAHRSPDLVAEYAKGLSKRGVRVVIAGAGGAAHLAGVVAAHSTLPVIGVPITSVINGIDSLLATVQMPKGVPVATVAIGKPGAGNAGYLAVQILALNSRALQTKLDQHKNKLVNSIVEKNKKLEQKLKSS
jgi:phosphoribosylaminoimidazole carboxylase PurE protein